MSLIIKGMDMPKSGESMTYSSKEIIEIPRPHGRLIDENELLRHKYGFSQTARVIIKTTDAVIEAEE